MDIDILLIVTIQFLFLFGENLHTDDDNSRTVIEEEIYWTVSVTTILEGTMACAL